MIGIWFTMIFLTILAVLFSRRGSLEQHPSFLMIMLFAIPLPYIAGQLGWIVAEVGRQPWIVYGVLKTSAAVSKAIDTTQVYVSLLGFTLLYGSLGAIDIYLLSKVAKKGPADNISTLLKPPRQEA